MLQRFFKTIANSGAFHYFIIFAILASCALIVLDTWGAGIDIHNYYIDLFDKVIIFVFLFEVIVKITAEGKNPGKYFEDPWNVFDFIITIVCLLSLIPLFSAFRIVRVLRVFRLFSTIPKLQLWVGALLRSLPSISYVFLLLIIIFFTYGAMGVYLFSENDPFHFGDLPNALLSLFRIITLEDWTDIMYHNIQGAAAYPESVYALNVPDITPTAPHGFGWIAVVYFVTFVLLCVFIILNMFTGVVLSAIQEMKSELEEEVMKKSIEDIIGDKAELKNTLPHVSPDDFEQLTLQLIDIQNKLVQLKTSFAEKQ